MLYLSKTHSSFLLRCCFTFIFCKIRLAVSFLTAIIAVVFTTTSINPFKRSYNFTSVFLS